jgi:hypothetical protein
MAVMHSSPAHHQPSNNSNGCTIESAASKQAKACVLTTIDGERRQQPVRGAGRGQRLLGRRAVHRLPEARHGPFDR